VDIFCATFQRGSIVVLRACDPTSHGPRRSLPSLQIPLAASHAWRPIRKCHPISPPSSFAAASVFPRRPHPLCANAATRARPALLPLPPAKPWTSAGTLGPALLHLPFDPHHYRSTEYKLDGARANSTWLGHHWYVISQFPSSDIGHGEGCRLHQPNPKCFFLLSLPSCSPILTLPPC